MILLEKILLLRGISLFKGINNELLTDLAYCAREERVAQDRVIMKEGEIEDTMYIIVEGKVAVKKGDLTLAVLGSHKTVGEYAVLAPAPRSATVIALEETLLLELKRDQLFTQFAFDIEFWRGITEELCNRIRKLSAQFADTH